MLSTAGFTCVAFVTGAFSWWGPKFLQLGLKIQSNGQDVDINEYALFRVTKGTSQRKIKKRG